MNSISFSTTRHAVADDGVRIAYAVAPATAHGSPRVLLVHSLALDRSFWDGVAASVAGRLELLAVDCRGHGGSDRAPGPYTLERMADDVAAVLDDAGWGNAVVCGCSMGGCVAMAFAARHPGRTAALVVMDTTAWYGPDAAKAWDERAERARRGGMAALLPFQRERWLGETFRQAHPEVQAEAEAVFLRNDVECYAATCAMLGGADLRGVVETIRAPAAVLVGSEDGAAPPAMAEDVARRLGGIPVRVLQGARHFTPLERPDEITAVLLEMA